MSVNVPVSFDDATIYSSVANGMLSATNRVRCWSICGNRPFIDDKNVSM